MNDISETKETIFGAITKQYGLPGNVLVLYHTIHTRNMLMLVGQRMAIHLMRLDGDDSRAQYIQVYLSVYL